MDDRPLTPHELVFSPASEIPVLERIRRLDWESFEDFVGDVYRRAGYVVEAGGGAKPDGGYDLVPRRENEMIIVQCKHWLAWKVGVRPVRELAGALHKAQASRAILVTTGVFTMPARQFAKDMPLELIDGDGLLEMKSVGIPIRAEAVPTKTSELVATEPASDSPLCPKCGKTMVVRTGKRGPQIGTRFWGCMDFPRCWGKREWKEQSGYAGAA